jgi:hypothetical protein
MIVQRTAFALIAGAALAMVPTAITTIASPAIGWADTDPVEADSPPVPVCPDQVFDTRTGTCMDPLSKMAADFSAGTGLPPLPDASTLASNLAGVPGLINPNVTVPVSVGLPSIGLPALPLPQAWTLQMPQMPAPPLPALPAPLLPAVPGVTSPANLCAPPPIGWSSGIPFVGWQPCI